MRLFTTPLLLGPLLLAAPQALSQPVATSASASLAGAQDPVAQDLIQRGRKLLDAGDPKEAQVLFEQADAKSGGALETHIWVLRAWMDQGRINDAFNAIDRLRNKGAEGPAVDYVYGMGSYRRALTNLAQGLNNTTAYAFGDTVQFLGSVLEADPKTYYDAWVPLTHACWASSEFERGRQVAKDAVAARPKDPQAHYWQGRVVFSLYQQAMGADPEAAETSELGQAAWAALERSVELTEATKENAQSLHETNLQLGYLALWQKRPEASKAPFVEAIGWEPSSVDYGALFGSLQDDEGGPAPFVDVLSRGHELFVKRWGTATSSDATLLWWLGWGQASLGQHAQAEASYLSAVKKWPAYVDSYWYAGRARYFQEDYVGAVKAWSTLAETHPETLVQMIAADAENQVPLVRFANAKTNEAMLQGDLSLNVDMARVAEAVLAADGAKAEHWNDVGLFSRDAGIYVNSLEEDGAEEQAKKLWERSWAAYQKAIELDPEDPAYINDGAVILDYYLNRELDKAEAMYKQAAEMAQAQLDAGTVPEAELDLVRTALRDAKDNLARLQRRREEAGG